MEINVWIIWNTRKNTYYESRLLTSISLKKKEKPLTSKQESILPQFVDNYIQHQSEIKQELELASVNRYIVTTKWFAPSLSAITTQLALTNYNTYPDRR